MKELTGTARNLYLVPGDPAPRPMVEVVLVTSEPRFTVDEAGRLVESRVTDSLRVHTTPSGLRQLAKSLVEWADEAQEEAAALDWATGADARDKPKGGG